MSDEQQWRVVSAQQSGLMHNIAAFELAHESYGRARALVAYAMDQAYVDHIDAADREATKSCLLWLESELSKESEHA